MLKEKFMRSKIQPADDDGDCPPKSNELQQRYYNRFYSGEGAGDFLLFILGN